MPVSFTVSVTGQDVLASLGETIRIADSRMRANILDAASAQVKDEMIANTPVGRTGKLRDSIGVKKVSASVRTIGPKGGHGSVSSPLPAGYALPVEEGNIAHFPNVNDIMSRYGVDKGNAYAIAKKIAKSEGKAYNFVRDTVPIAERILYDTTRKFIDLYLAFR